MNLDSTLLDHSEARDHVNKDVCGGNKDLDSDKR